MLPRHKSCVVLFHLSGWKSTTQLLHSLGYAGDGFRRMLHDWAAGILTFTTLSSLGAMGVYKRHCDLDRGLVGKALRRVDTDAWLLHFQLVGFRLLHAGILAYPDLWGRDTGLGATPCTSISLTGESSARHRGRAALWKQPKRRKRETRLSTVEIATLSRHSSSTLYPSFCIILLNIFGICCHVSWKLQALKVLSCGIWSSDPALGALVLQICAREACPYFKQKRSCRFCGGRLGRSMARGESSECLLVFEGVKAPKSV